ncbi:hypothetical protein LEN26_003731 [Aphanomyces euteiches]|nr:hypothetical protein AeMF1_018827 [Aphanomyces euteiches]KAH9152321.1 hypothetical protein LEN26_003731 [Aphanomyces euteiches]
MENTMKDDDNDEEELDMELLEKFDHKLRRRIYLRKMRQIYRNEERQEREYLHHKIAELEEIIKPLQEQAARRKAWTLLPWKDIADELGEECDNATTEWSHLKAQVEEYEEIVRIMKKWVATNCALKCSLDGRVSTWRDNSLPANPQSRHLGKEWITKQLYYNATRMFHAYGFPPTDCMDDFHLFDMDLETSAGVQYVFGGQFNDVSSESLALLYCGQTCSVLMANLQHRIPSETVKESDGDMQLHQMVTANGEFVNVLAASFNEEGRFVAVVQDILDDETVELDDRFRLRRYRTYWVEVFCLPSGQWKRRFLYLLSQQCGPLGPIRLEEEALTWGCNLEDVAPQLRPVRFRHEFLKMCARLCPHGGFFNPENAASRRRR